MRAWHFTGGELRDGRPVPKPGVTLTHDGPLELCMSGLHASIEPLDALRYAPGSTVHRVALGGQIVRGNDKVAATERTILWSVDATDTLEKSARLCALDVIDLWDADDIVVRHLRTGDESLRAAAWAAARAAADAAARNAAWAARAAAWAAEAAAEAARDAADAAARNAADAAAWAAAWAARAAEAAAEAAAEDSAWEALREKQNRRLRRMLMGLKPTGEEE